MITSPENTPNEHIGIMGVKHVAIKDTAVVRLVINMALEAFLKVYVSLSAILFLSTLICFELAH